MSGYSELAILVQFKQEDLRGADLLTPALPRRDRLLSRKEFSVERGELEEDADRRAELRQGLQVQRVDLSVTDGVACIRDYS